MLDLTGIIYFIRRICKGGHKKLLGRKSRKGRQKRKARSKRSMKASNTKGCRLYLSVLIVILIEYYKSNFWRETPLRKSINQLAPYRVNYYKRRYYDSIFSDLTAGHELVFSLFKALKLSFISNSYRDIVKPLVTLTASVGAKVIILEETREETRAESERANTEQEMEVMSTLTEQKPSDESQTSTEEQPETSSMEPSLIDDTVTNKEQPKTESAVNPDEAQDIIDALIGNKLTSPEDIVIDEEQTKAEDDAPSDKAQNIIPKQIETELASPKDMVIDAEQPKAQAIIDEQPEATAEEDTTEDIEQLKAEINSITEKLEALEQEIIAAFNEQPTVLGKNNSTRITPCTQNDTNISSSSRMRGSSDDNSVNGTNDLFEGHSSILDPRIREDDEVDGDDVAIEQIEIKSETGTGGIHDTYHDKPTNRTNDLYEWLPSIPDPRSRKDDEDGNDGAKATEQVEIDQETGTDEVKGTHYENKRRLLFDKTSLEEQTQEAISNPIETLTPLDCYDHKPIPTIHWYHQISLFAMPLLTLALIGVLALLHKQVKQRIRTSLMLIEKQNTIEAQNVELAELRRQVSTQSDQLEELTMNYNAALADNNRLGRKDTRWEKALSDTSTLIELIERFDVFSKAELRGEILNSHELEEQASVVRRLQEVIESVPQSIKDEGLTPHQLGEAAVISLLSKAGQEINPRTLGEATIVNLLYSACRSKLEAEAKIAGDLDHQVEQN